MEPYSLRAEGPNFCDGSKRHHFSLAIISFTIHNYFELPRLTRLTDYIMTFLLKGTFCTLRNFAEADASDEPMVSAAGTRATVDASSGLGMRSIRTRHAASAACCRALCRAGVVARWCVRAHRQWWLWPPEFYRKARARRCGYQFGWKLIVYMRERWRRLATPAI